MIYFVSANLKVSHQEIASGLQLSGSIVSQWMFSRKEFDIKTSFCCLSNKMFYLQALSVRELFFLTFSTHLPTKALMQSLQTKIATNVQPGMASYG